MKFKNFKNLSKIILVAIVTSTQIIITSVSASTYDEYPKTSGDDTLSQSGNFTPNDSQGRTGVTWIDYMAGMAFVSFNNFLGHTAASSAANNDERRFLLIKACTDFATLNVDTTNEITDATYACTTDDSYHNINDNLEPGDIIRLTNYYHNNGEDPYDGNSYNPNTVSNKVKVGLKLGTDPNTPDGIIKSTNGSTQSNSTSTLANNYYKYMTYDSSTRKYSCSSTKGGSKHSCISSDIISSTDNTATDDVFIDLDKENEEYAKMGFHLEIIKGSAYLMTDDYDFDGYVPEGGMSYQTSPVSGGASQTIEVRAEYEYDPIYGYINAAYVYFSKIPGCTEYQGRVYFDAALVADFCEDIPLPDIWYDKSGGTSNVKDSNEYAIAPNEAKTTGLTTAMNIQLKVDASTEVWNKNLIIENLSNNTSTLTHTADSDGNTTNDVLKINLSSTSLPTDLSYDATTNTYTVKNIKISKYSIGDSIKAYIEGEENLCTNNAQISGCTSLTQTLANTEIFQSTKSITTNINFTIEKEDIWGGKLYFAICNKNYTQDQCIKNESGARVNANSTELSKSTIKPPASNRNELKFENNSWYLSYAYNTDRSNTTFDASLTYSPTNLAILSSGAFPVAWIQDEDLRCGDSDTLVVAGNAICTDDAFSTTFYPNIIDFDAVEEDGAPATIESTTTLNISNTVWEGIINIAVCSDPSSPANCIASLSSSASNDYTSDLNYITNNYFSLSNENISNSVLKISHSSANTTLTSTNFIFTVNSNNIARGESVFVWIDEYGVATACFEEQYYCNEFGNFEVENEGNGIGAVFKKIIQTANAKTVIHSPVTVSSPEEIIKASVEVFGSSSNWKGDVFLGICSNLDINDPYLDPQDCIDNAPTSEIIFQNAYIAPNSSTTIDQVTDANKKRVGEFDSSDYDANNNINILTQDGGLTFANHVINFNLSGAQNYISSEIKGINEPDLYVALWCDGQAENCFEIVPIILRSPVCENLDATINDLTYITDTKAFLLPNETLPTTGYAAEIAVDSFSPDSWEGNLILDSSNANAKYDCDNNGSADDKSCTIITAYGDTIERDYYFADGNDKLSISTEDGSSTCKEDLQLTACKDLFITDINGTTEISSIYVKPTDSWNGFDISIPAYNDKWKNQFIVKTANGYLSSTSTNPTETETIVDAQSAGWIDSTFIDGIYYKATQALFDSHEKGLIRSYVINEDLRCNAEINIEYCGDGTLQAQEGEECDYGINNGKDGYTCDTECQITAPSTVGVCNDSFTTSIDPAILDFEAGENTIDAEAKITLTDPDGDGEFMWDKGQVHVAICNNPASVTDCLDSLSNSAITAWTNANDYPTELQQKSNTGYNTAGYLILEATGETFDSGTLKLNFQATNVSKGESIVVWATDIAHSNETACAYIQNYCTEFGDFNLTKQSAFNISGLFASMIAKVDAVEPEPSVTIRSSSEIYKASIDIFGTSSAWTGDVYLAVCKNLDLNKSNAKIAQECIKNEASSSTINYDNIFINTDQQYLDDDPNIDNVKYYDSKTHAIIYSVSGKQNTISADISGINEPDLYITVWCDQQEVNCLKVIPINFAPAIPICEEIKLSLKEDSNWKKIGTNSDNDDVYLLPNATKSTATDKNANLSGYFNDDNWTSNPDTWTGDIDFERTSSANPLFYNETTCNPATASCVFEDTNGTENPWTAEYQSAYAGDKITISGLDNGNANCIDTIEITACDNLSLTDENDNSIDSIYINSSDQKTVKLITNGHSEAWQNTVNANTTNGAIDPSTYTASGLKNTQTITYTPNYEDRALADGISSFYQAINASVANEDLRCKAEINIEYCGDMQINGNEKCDDGDRNETLDSNCSDTCEIVVCEDLNITDINYSNYRSSGNIDYYISIAPENWSGAFTTEILRQGLGNTSYGSGGIVISTVQTSNTGEISYQEISSCDGANLCTANLNLSDSKNLLVQINNLDADDKVTFYTDDKSEQCSTSDTFLLLGDYVWFDQNSDGIQNDPSENGINETTVNLYSDPDSDGICSPDDFIESTITSNDLDGNSGYYYFPVDANSQYCVEFINPQPDQYAVCPQFQESNIETDSNPDPNTGSANAQIIENSDLSIDACYFLPVCEDLNITDINYSNYRSSGNIDYYISIAPENWSGAFTTEILRQGLGNTSYGSGGIVISTVQTSNTGEISYQEISSCDGTNLCTANLNLSDSKNLFIQINGLDADDKVTFYTDDKSEQCSTSDTLLLLGDYVWFDQNGDGIQNDPSENGINETTVNLYSDPDSDGICSPDDFIESTITSNDLDGNSGYYYFPVDANSQYCVEFINPQPDQYAVCPQFQESNIETDSNPDPNTGSANAQIIENSDLSIDACYFLPVCLDLLVNSDYSNIYDKTAVYTVSVDSNSTIADLWTGDIIVKIYDENDKLTEVDSIIFDDGNSQASCTKSDISTEETPKTTCDPAIDPMCIETQSNPEPVPVEPLVTNLCDINPTDPTCQTVLPTEETTETICDPAIDPNCTTQQICDPIIDPTCNQTTPDECILNPADPACLTQQTCDPITNPTCVPLPTTEPLPNPLPQTPLITKTDKNHNLFTSIINLFTQNTDNLKTDLLASYTETGSELKCSAQIDSEVSQPITITINGLLPDYRVEILTNDNDTQANRCYFSEKILKLGNFVWIDNGDFIQSETEQNSNGQNGINVQLYQADKNGICTDILLDETQTQNDPDTESPGYYYFPAEPNTDYCVTFAPLPGYEFCPQNTGDNITTDSNPNPSIGIANNIHIAQENDITIDACYTDIACQEITLIKDNENLNNKTVPIEDYDPNESFDFEAIVSPTTWLGTIEAISASPDAQFTINQETKHADISYKNGNYGDTITVTADNGSCPATFSIDTPDCISLEMADTFTTTSTEDNTSVNITFDVLAENSRWVGTILVTSNGQGTFKNPYIDYNNPNVSNDSILTSGNPISINIDGTKETALYSIAIEYSGGSDEDQITISVLNEETVCSDTKSLTNKNQPGGSGADYTICGDGDIDMGEACDYAIEEGEVDYKANCTSSCVISTPSSSSDETENGNEDNEDEDNTTAGGGGNDEDETPQVKQTTKEPLFDKRAFLNNNTAVKSASIPEQNDHANYILTYWNNGSNYSSLTVTDTLGELGIISGYSNEKTTGDYIKPWPDSEFYYNYELEKWPNNATSTIADCVEDSVELCHIAGTSIFSPNGAQFSNISDDDIIAIIYQGKFKLGKFDCNDGNCGAEEFQNTANANATNTSGQTKTISDSDILYALCKYLITRNSGDVLLYSPLESGADLSCLSSNEVRNTTGLAITKDQPTTATLPSTGAEDYEATESLCDNREDNGSVISDFSSFICELKLEILDIWQPDNISDSIEENIEREAETYENLNTFDNATSKNITINYLSDLDALDSESPDPTKKIYRKTDGGNLIINPANENFFTEGAYTFIIENGNLIIEGNLKYNDDEYNYGQIPSVAFIVIGGNIEIASNVTDIVGVYYTETNDEGLGGEIQSQDSSHSDYQLRIYGSVFGDLNPIISTRDYIGDPERDGANVKIIYDARILLNTPPALEEFIGTSFTDIAR